MPTSNTPQLGLSDLSSMLEHSGRKIILPSDPTPMTIAAAIDFLMKISKEQQVVSNVVEVINAYPLEGAHAFTKAMGRMFGWATPLPGGFFQAPPQTLNLEIGYKKNTQIIWGRFALPGIDGELSCGVNVLQGGRLVFSIQGKVRKLHLPTIQKLADLTRQIVEEESIYRGQAISLNTDDDGDVMWNVPPSFLDIEKIKETELIFSQEVMKQVQTNVFTPIEHTVECRHRGIPLKRGVLLEGQYGTGKTLIAHVTSKKSVQNGWTFLMVDRVSGLRSALELAKNYQPCVVFAEDIDREVSGETRTTRIDDVLNTIDGVGAKDTEIMVILTSNHVEDINSAMLRPGRLDAIISVLPPDANAVQRLIHLYARGQLDPDSDLRKVGTVLEGQIPAVIREVVERSKLYSIGRGDKEGMITVDDLLASAYQMITHVRLLESKQKKQATEAEKVFSAIQTVLSVSPSNTKSNTTVEDVLSRLEDMESTLGSTLEGVENRTGKIVDLSESAAEEANNAHETAKEILEIVETSKGSKKAA